MYRYTFGGKEFNTDFGLKLNDFGARWYDPAVGRWGGVDPLADQFAAHSPYHYAYNNPLRFIDPDGRSATNCCNNLVTFYNDFKTNGFKAVTNTFNSAKSLLTGDDNSRAQAATRIGSVSGGIDRLGTEMKTATLEAARAEAQAINKAAETVEIAALSETVITGGLSSEVTVPIAIVADRVGTGALIVEAAVDILQDGSVRPETMRALGLKATFAGLSGAMGKAFDNVLGGFSKPDASDVTARAVGDAMLKTAEVTTGALTEPKE